MSSNLYTAKSAQELESLSETHGIQVLAQLESKYSSRSPSEWGFPHLLALRALYSPDKPFLSELNSEHESNCPVCCEVSPQKVDYDSINSLIGNHPNLNNSSERELTRRPAGSFWLAMATIVARGTEGKREYPQRERKQVMRDGYVSTTASAFGSSPSNAGFGSSPTTASADFDIEMRELDDDEHDERRLQPEQLTVELFSSLVRYVLNYCLDQSDNIKEKKGKVRLRIERKTSTASVGDLSITAEDDGGICWMSQMVDGWHMSNANIALLEAKRAPTAIRYDERTQSYYPVVSNEHLAQYLGEAVVTWRANRDSIKDQ